METGGGAESLAALTHGDIDMAKIFFADAINGVAQGADIRLILTANPRSDLVFVGGSGVETLADIRGKKVLFSTPGPSTTNAVLPPLLEEAGIEEGDYEAEYVQDSQNRSAALANGRADATTLETVDIELAGQEAELNRLVDLGAGVPEPINVFAVRNELIEEDPALLEDVVQELLAGYEALYRPEGRDAWLREAQDGDLAEQPEEVASRIYEGYRKLGYWPRGDPYTEAQHRRALEFAIGGKLAEEPVPFDEAWDTSFWTAAAQGG